MNISNISSVAKVYENNTSKLKIEKPVIEERYLRLKARGDSEESIINRFKIEDNEGEIDISEANEFKTYIFSENLSPENYLLKIKKEVFE